MDIPVAAATQFAGQKMRCVRCGSGNLAEASPGEYYLCGHCGARFPIIQGVPFLIGYTQDEGESLFELTAKMGQFEEKTTRASQSFFAQKLVEAYESGKPAEVKKTLQSGNRDFFDKRYRQYQNLRQMLSVSSLEGRNILDIGAGSGFDTLLLQMLGARVTAVEFNPYSVLRGKEVAGDATWICASASCLPFENGSFDYVVANAALHHMVKVSDVVAECLRVLRVGGTFISINDPFKSGHLSPDHDLKIFNEHPVVRRGVNELISYFEDFVRPLVTHQDELIVELRTDRLRRFDRAGKLRKTIERPRTWTLDKAPRLRRTGGSLSMRVEKRMEGRWPESLLKGECLPVNLVFGDVTRPAALKNIANFLPRERMTGWLERKSGNSKLELLNGWQFKDRRKEGRRARGTANLYLVKDSAGTQGYSIEIARDAGEGELNVALDGNVILQEAVNGGSRVFFELPEDRLSAIELSVLSVSLNTIHEQPAFILRQL